MKKSATFMLISGAVILVACAVLVSAYFRGKKENTPSYTAEFEMTYPTVTVSYGEQELNTLLGYAAPVNMESMYPALTPLDASRTVTLHISSAAQKVKAVNASVYTLDGELAGEVGTQRLISGDSYESAALNLSQCCEQGVEYLVQLRMETMEQENLYYYMRVCYEQKTIFEECFAFVKEFINKTFDKKQVSELAVYMETDASAAEQSLRRIDIHADTALLSWGELSPVLCSEPHFSLVELQEETAVLRAIYQIAVQETEEANSYYTVEEVFRVRKSDYRVHLIDYERTVTQLFSPSAMSYSMSQITLGLADEQVQIQQDQKARYVSWVQAGELWQYQREDHRIAKVFSMQDVQNHDQLQSFVRPYEIRILDQQEDGGLDFCVYGYFVRGRHEGKVGSALCHYDPSQGGYEELVFFSSDQPEEWYISNADKLMYKTGNRFYFYYENAVMLCDLEDGSVQAIAADLEEGAFVASERQDCIAWEHDMNSAKSIECLNLNTGAARTVSAADGEYIRAVGYVGMDFVYGRARISEQTRAGSTLFLMYAIDIVNEQGDTVKTYEDEVNLVASGWADDSMIQLERARAADSGGGYVSTDSHQILSNAKEETEEAVSTALQTDSKKGSVVSLCFEQPLADGRPDADITPRIRETNSISLDRALAEQDLGRQQSLYYVYCAGKLYSANAQSAGAVSDAASVRGTVRGPKGIVYRYIVPPAEGAVEQERANVPADVLTSAGSIADAWSAASGQPVYDVSGITLQDALVYTAQGALVLVEYAQDAYALITGYTGYAQSGTVTMQDVSSGQEYSYSVAEASEQCAAVGNVFVCQYP